MTSEESALMSAVGEQAPEPDVVAGEDGITDVDETQEVIPDRYSITSYGADFLVDGLVSRLRSNDIVIPSFDPAVETSSGIEGFQRGFVWTKAQADAFVESLLLGFPVPGIFLVTEPNNVLLVLDGQQRLRTLRAFYDGTLRGKDFTLNYVQSQFRGKMYATLDDEDRRRLDNSIIHATIVRQEEPANEHGAIYLIFQRLNSGGTPLQPQEIRVALFHGSLLTLLRDTNANDEWRQLVGPPSPRLKDQELALRFLALNSDGGSYSRPMVGFLNDFMEAHRNPGPDELAAMETTFRATVSAISQGIGARAFRLTANVIAAVADSVMVGVADRLRQGPLDATALEPAYRKLLENTEYRTAVERATSNEESVRTRLKLAREAFATVR